MIGEAGVNVCAIPGGICKAMGKPTALIFLPAVPGLYHRRVTPAPSHLTPREQLSVDVNPNVSI